MSPALEGIKRREDGPMVVPKASSESRCHKFSNPHRESVTRVVPSPIFHNNSRRTLPISPSKNGCDIGTAGNDRSSNYPR